MYSDSLPMGYAHAAGALIAEAEDPFAVADHNRFDTIEAWMSQDAPNGGLV